MRAKKMVTGIGLVAVAALSGWVLGHGEGGEKVTAAGPTKVVRSISRVTEVVNQESPALVAHEEPVAVPASSTLEEKGLQVDQLVKGDFSSLAGTWANSTGHVLTFSADGLVSGGGEVTGIEASGYGTVKGHYILKPVGGGAIEFIPAGIVLQDYTYEQDGGEVILPDISDSHVDRIWMGQDMSMRSDAASFYYRVD